MRTSQPSRHAVRALKATVVGLFTAGAIALGIGGPAVAGGVSESQYNCYTQWWNTAWAQKCYEGGNSVIGKFESGVNCSYQGGRSFTIYRGSHSTATYSGTDCTFSASGGWLHYLGY